MQALKVVEEKPVVKKRQKTQAVKRQELNQIQENSGVTVEVGDAQIHIPLNETLTGIASWFSTRSLIDLGLVKISVDVK